jgi:hypothetical protein
MPFGPTLKIIFPAEGNIMPWTFLQGGSELLSRWKHSRARCFQDYPMTSKYWDKRLTYSCFFIVPSVRSQGISHRKTEGKKPESADTGGGMVYFDIERAM